MTDEQSWQPPSGPTAAGHAAPPHGQAPHGHAATGHPGRGQEQGAQAPNGQPPVPYGQAPYGQAPYGQAPYGQAPYGQAPYGQAPYGQAPYGQPGPGAAWQQPAWTPPPKPGLIPLRPLSFGTLLGAPFQVLRRNPRATFGSALLVQAVTVLVSLLVLGPLTFLAVDRMESAGAAEFDEVMAGSVATLLLATLVPVLFGVLASALLQGVIVVEVARATLGEKMRLLALWRSVFRRAWPLLGWILLLGLGYTGGIAVAAGIVVALAVQGPGLLWLTITVGLLLGLGLLVLFVWATVKTSLVPCMIVLEERGVGAAIRRSWQLTTGYFWKTLGVQLLVAVIVNTVSQIVTLPVSLLYSFAATFIDPNNMLGTLWPAIASYVLLMLVTLVVGSIAIVAQAATIALIYIDLRMRTEGLDIELARFVEARELGASDIADPYLPRPRTQPAP